MQAKSVGLQQHDGSKPEHQLAAEAVSEILALLVSPGSRTSQLVQVTPATVYERAWCLPFPVVSWTSWGPWKVMRICIFASLRLLTVISSGKLVFSEIHPLCYNTVVVGSMWWWLIM